MTTPVGALLALAGLANLQPRCTYMFCPPRAPRGKEHYLYRRGSGWDLAGTLTRTEAKYDVIGGQYVTIPAGQIGANGRIEPQARQLISPIASPLGADWAFDGLTLGDAVTGPDGTLSGRTVTLAAGGDKYVGGTVAVSAGTFTVSCWIKAAAPTTIRLGIYDGSGGGGWCKSSDFAVTTAWTRFSFTYALTGANAQPLVIDATDGLGKTVDVALLNFCEASYATTIIPTIATRSADALRATGLSGLNSVGGMLVFLRAPYPGTMPAADQYHIGLNGADSLDDGIFLFTESADDHLYAEVRSGGVSQGTVDLGAYVAGTQYAVALDWDASGLRAAINGVEKTATGAVTVPASIDRLEIGRGIAADTAHGGETPGILLFDSARTVAERAALTGAEMRAAMFGGL